MAGFLLNIRGSDTAGANSGTVTIRCGDRGFSRVSPIHMGVGCMVYLWNVYMFYWYLGGGIFLYGTHQKEPPHIENTLDERKGKYHWEAAAWYRDRFWAEWGLCSGGIAAVFVQSSAEELVCRGFMYQRFLKSYGKPSIAIVGNALFFGVLHLSNEGVTFLSLVNIFLFGILFSFIVYYMDSIWCAFAVHTAWNFMQNILFGLPNSGIVVPYSMFKLEAGTAANSFAYHVGFGIEGTLLANAVLLAAGIAMYFWGKRVKKNDSSQSVCTAATERKNFNTVE